MSDRNYHRIGSLFPESGHKSQFAQLYMYDTNNEIGNKINTFQDNNRATFLDHDILHGLSQMMASYNILAKSFRMTRYRFKSYPQSLF